LAPDRISWGTYLLLSYRLPLPGLNIRPFALLGWVDFDDNTPHENTVSVRLGANWRVSGAIVFKIEYIWGHWPNQEPGDRTFRLSSGDTHFLVLQLALAF
jgi:hypothetical protein